MQKKWIDGIVAVGKRHRWAAPLLIALLAVLFGTAAVAKWCGELSARLRSGAGRRIMASALAVCMVFTLLPTNAFAAEGSIPNGLACHTVHDKGCGYSETYKAGGCTHEHDGECGYEEGSEGAPCTYTPNEGETEPHEHNDDCGYKAAVPGKNCTHEHDSGECGYAETVTVTSPCTHKCALCEGNNSSKPEQPEQPEECVCTVLCTEEAVDGGCPVCGGENTDPSLCEGNNSSKPMQPVQPDLCVCTVLCTEETVDGGCSVCGGENADPSLCQGEAAPATPSEAAQAVIDLIDALPSTDEIYNSAVGDSEPGYDDWLEDTWEILRRAQEAQAAFDALDKDEKAAVGEERTDKLAALVSLSSMLPQVQPLIETPTVESKSIYANGTALLLVAGSPNTSNTVIYIDNDRDGIKDVGDTIFSGGLANTDDTGNDLSSYTIYGGSRDKDLTGDTQIIMNGGSVGGIYGGGRAESASANVTGSTKITVTGGEVASTIRGGGYAGFYGTANVTDTANITITGGEVTGAIYGGGNAYFYGRANVTNNVNIQISGTAKVGSNVYGGGNAEFGGDTATVGTANITVNGTATVGRSVFGGGNSTGSGDVTVSNRTLTIGGGAQVGSNGDSYGVVINGGSGSVANGVDKFAIDPPLSGDASVTVVLPQDYDASGNPVLATNAVQGDLAKITLVGDGATGNETYFESNAIKVRETMLTPTVEGTDIYANGAPLLLEAGTTDGNTVIYIDKNRDGIKNDGDTIFSGDMLSDGETGNNLSIYMIYGGSKDTKLDGDTQITINGGVVSGIYGGGNGTGGDANVTGNTKITMTGGKVSGSVHGSVVRGIFGGGNGTGGSANVDGTVSITVSGTAKVSGIYGGGNAGGGSTATVGTANITVNGAATVGNFFYGGGMAGGGGTATVGTANITISDTAKVSGIYGGGSASGGSVANVGSADIEITGGEVSGIYSGGSARSGAIANVTDSVTIQISGSAKVRSNVYGGGSASGGSASGGSVANVGSVNITVSGTATVGSVYGGGSANGGSASGGSVATVGSVGIEIIGGEVNGTIYGGGYAYYKGVANVGSVGIEITGGEVKSTIYGGGYAFSEGMAEVTNNVNIQISGTAKVRDVYGGSSTATVGTANITVNGTATVDGSVYGGGNAGGTGSGDVTVSSRTLTIGGGAQVGNGYSYGVVINGGSGSVANGVDSFAIAPALSGDARVHVKLPAGYTTGTIATGAVQGDLARIKLVGPGAAGKMTYFEDNAIKVGPPPAP